MPTVRVTMHDAAVSLPGDAPPPPPAQPYDPAAARAILAERRAADQRLLDSLNSLHRLQHGYAPTKDR